MLQSARPTSHIFVVGLARTGTHLVRSILNTSEKVHLGPESHFLGGAPRLGFLARPGILAAFPGPDAPLSEKAADRLVGRLVSGAGGRLGRAPYWRSTAKVEGADALRRRFVASARRPQDLLAAALEIQARGRPIGGDKTPSNLFYVPTIVDWFPDARVIQIIRDPRAVYASAQGKGFVGPRRLGLPSARPLQLVLGFWWAIDLARRWRRAMDLDQRFQERFPSNYTSLRFEDLVNDPEPEIRHLCDFVGVPYTETMLDRPVVSSSFLPRGTRGIRAEAREKWRAELPAILARWIALLCGSRLTERGYPVS